MIAQMPPLTPEHIARLVDVAPEVARLRGYRLVLLFGSAARGAPHPEDLDLGIIAEGVLEPVEAANAFIEALRTQHVDIVDLRRTDPLVAMVAAREGRVLYEAREGEFARFASLAARRYADTAGFRQREHHDLVARIARLRETTP